MNGRPFWLFLCVLSAYPSGTLKAQAPAPTLEVHAPIGGTNLSFFAGTQPGWFYTLQSSTDLSNWVSVSSLFADANALSWTDAIAAGPVSKFYRAKVNPPNLAVVTNYNGWTNAVLLNNGLVEALVIPNAGRVLQFRFAGNTNGPFWENRSLYGRTTSSTIWNTEGAFGGDKAWPSPQSDWGWPPPVGFDGSVEQVGITNGIATLTTPVDGTYKIQTTRVVELGFDEPVMRITTTFHRTAATTRTNNPVGIWVITQFQDPVRCYAPVPAPSVFPTGYHQLGTGLPTQFQNTNGLISFARDPVNAHKLGFDANALAWVGTNLSIRVDAPRVAGLPLSSYPDGGCNTEIYTNPGTNAMYVEFESLGPLSKLPVGGQMQFVTKYNLFNRTESTPEAEARKILNLPR
ncbi:MAG TPA: hypothetical protein VL361_28375 [Candidatus Limnocylindrales bacterium]|nr:hypothetical protein [Candidatus Limnocylindrales bacterium]